MDNCPQKMSAPNKSTYLNKGKIEELVKLKETWNYDTVIVDDELTPTQQQTLEDLIEGRVIDRLGFNPGYFCQAGPYS